MKSIISTICFLSVLAFAGDRASKTFSSPLPPEGVASIPASSFSLSAFLPMIEGFQIGQEALEQDSCGDWVESPAYGSWNDRVDNQQFRECQPTLNIPL